MPRFHLALALLLGAMAPAALAAPPGAEVITPAKSGYPFTPGEELVYKITALGMTAGKARISVGLATERDGVKAWPVVVQARTDALFDRVYKVRDRFVTWWHPESGRVLGADLYADQNGKRQRTSSRIDHASGKAEVLRQREADGERTQRTYDVPAGAYDIAGAIFELRRRDLVPGSIHEVDVFTGRKVFKLRCAVEGLQQVKTGAGSFEALAVRIQLGFDGHFASRRDVRAWFSADERRLPLRFEAEFALGTLVADLLEAKRGIRL